MGQREGVSKGQGATIQHVSLADIGLIKGRGGSRGQTWSGGREIHSEIFRTGVLLLRMVPGSLSWTFADRLAVGLGKWMGLVYQGDAGGR